MRFNVRKGIAGRWALPQMLLVPRQSRARVALELYMCSRATVARPIRTGRPKPTKPTKTQGGPPFLTTPRGPISSVNAGYAVESPDAPPTLIQILAFLKCSSREISPKG